MEDVPHVAMGLGHKIKSLFIKMKKHRKSVVDACDVIAKIRLPLSHSLITKFGKVVDKMVKERSPDRITIIGQEDGWIEFSTADKKDEAVALRRLHKTGRN